MKHLALVLILVFLTSCGYKPVSKVSQNILGKRVYADVKISIKDPENTVLLKDALLEAVVSRFGSSLVEKSYAQTLINVAIQSVTFKPIIYDKNGYVTSYKTRVILKIDTIFNDDKKQTYFANGEYDFPIEANSIISDTKRFEAIKNSSLDALDEYIAYISIKGNLWRAQ